MPGCTPSRRRPRVRAHGRCAGSASWASAASTARSGRRSPGAVPSSPEAGDVGWFVRTAVIRSWVATSPTPQTVSRSLVRFFRKPFIRGSILPTNRYHYFQVILNAYPSPGVQGASRVVAPGSGFEVGRQKDLIELYQVLAAAGVDQELSRLPQDAAPTQG